MLKQNFGGSLRHGVKSTLNLQGHQSLSLSLSSQEVRKIRKTM